MKKCIIFSLLIFMNNTSKAQFFRMKIDTPSNEKKYSGFKMIVDEDFFLDFFAPQEDYDRDYTGGGGFKVSGKFIEDYRLNILLRLADKITHLDQIHNQSHKRINELTLGITMFTPYGRDLNKPYPIKDDRPYASLTFLNATRISTDDLETTAIQTEFEIGALGLGLGGEIQGGIHKIYRQLNNVNDTGRPYKPVGWPLQISNGGEPTFLYGVQYKKLLNYIPIGTSHFFDANCTGYATIGHLTSIQAMLTNRIGLIRSKWYSFSSTGIGPQAEFLGEGGKKLPRFLRNAELYLFGTIHPKVILYNATLEEQFRESPVEYTFDQVNHFQLQLEGGLCLTLGFFNLQVTYVRRSPEIISPKAVPFEYVSLNIAFRPRFTKT